VSKLYVDQILENSNGSGIKLGSSIKTSSGSDIVSSSGVMGSNVSFPSGYFIPLKDMISSNGSTGTGSNVDMLSLSINLTGYTNYLLFAWCHTAISEQTNSSNTAIIRLKLTDGTNTTFISAQRQAIGAYSSSTWSAETIAYLGCQGYFIVTPTYAKSCTLTMNGGIDSGGFNWGDQGSYTNFDNETPRTGGTLGYILYRV
jgi:hypothetical protein